MTDVEQLKPGAEILFSTCAFINYPQPMYDPDVVDLFRRGPRPGTLLRGIVIVVTDNRGILLKQTSGFQRGCKRWAPFARMWTLKFAVPNPRYLRWYERFGSGLAGAATRGRAEPARLIGEKYVHAEAKNLDGK